MIWETGVCMIEVDRHTSVQYIYVECTLLRLFASRFCSLILSACFFGVYMHPLHGFWVAFDCAVKRRPFKVPWRTTAIIVSYDIYPRNCMHVCTMHAMHATNWKFLNSWYGNHLAVITLICFVGINTLHMCVYAAQDARAGWFCYIYVLNFSYGPWKCAFMANAEEKANTQLPKKKKMMKKDAWNCMTREKHGKYYVLLLFCSVLLLFRCFNRQLVILISLVFCPKHLIGSISRSSRSSNSSISSSSS